MPQRQWVLEARIDFLDRDKVKIIDDAFHEMSAYILAQLNLLADGGQKPQVVCHSDDFFTGAAQVNVLPDVIGKAKESQKVGEKALVSDEMLQAALDMQQAKAAPEPSPKQPKK